MVRTVPAPNGLLVAIAAVVATASAIVVGATAAPVMAATTPATASPATTGATEVSDPASTSATGSTAASPPTPVPALQGAANNSTAPRHRNPADVDEDGDLAATGEWLADRLADRLGDGAVRIDRGQYEAARRVVGDEFDSRLARLVDVAGETGTARDDRVASRLSDARDRQRRFTEAVADYRETRRAYRAARRAGNETRARALARELERAARTVNRTGGALSGDYAALTNDTDADLDAAVTAVRSTRRNVTDSQSSIRSETFVGTRLVAVAPARTVSFVEPLPVVGRLRAADGTALANRSVRLRVGTRTVRTRTNATGGFRVRYRPTLLAANATAVRVRYRPRNGSRFLGSEASVPVAVERVAPAVSVAAAPSPAGFGDRLSVSGSVTAAGVGVPSVPVVVHVGGTRVARVETAPNGSFAASVRLPAGVGTGDRAVRATVALSDRAIARANGSAVVTVRSTPAALTAAVRNRSAVAAAEVTGRLTADGRPVAGRPVAVRVDGSVVRTVTTDEDGRYAADLPTTSGASRSVRGGVTVTVVHDGTGSNVGNATARATLRSGGGDGGEGLAVLGAVVRAAGRPVPLAVGALALGVVGAGFVAVRRRRVAPDSGGDAGTAPEVGGSDAPTPLAAARGRLDAGEPADAIHLAYLAVREELTDGPGGRARTHREFREAAATPDGDAADALARLTDAYERAAFAPGTPERATAVDALEAAEVLLSE